MRVTGLRKKSGRQTQSSKQRNGDLEMSILIPQEKSFLDVFLHEATTSPFTGPATKALHQIGVEYSDISYIAWAYEQDVPHASFGWGHPAAVAPPLPWANREAALRRNEEIRQLWEDERKRGRSPNASWQV